MKAIFAACALTLISGAASAQSTYDWRTGNFYNTTPMPGGGAHVQGTNTRTGGMWQTNIDPSGNMNGIDSHMNSWNYNRGTGIYTNSNGHGCVGQGYARTCW